MLQMSYAQEKALSVVERIWCLEPWRVARGRFSRIVYESWSPAKAEPMWQERCASALMHVTGPEVRQGPY